VTRPWQGMEGEFDRWFASLNASGRTARGLSFGRTLAPRGAFDLGDFAGVQFGQVRSHLVATGLESGVGHVAATGETLLVAQVVQVAGAVRRGGGAVGCRIGPGGRELLHAVVHGVGHVHVAGRVDVDAVGPQELVVARAVRAPGAHHLLRAAAAGGERTGGKSV